jgi:nucleoside-diphosphate-sugar epimerase
VQAVHVDDLVAALELVIREDHPGIFNVASDGWLEHDDLRALLPRVFVPAYAADTLTRILRATWALGIGEIPPGVVPYLVHPWVIANDRLRALGWQPEHTNEQSILDGVASLPAPRRHTRSVAFATGAAAGAGVAAYVTGRQVRRQVRKSRAR